MNEGTAVEIAKGKMKELGVGENYILRYRHFRLDPLEKLTIKGRNELFIFIYPFYNITIESKMGLYDLEDEGLNELQHVHRGTITVTNKSKVRLDAKFIQAIPLEKRIKTNHNGRD